MNFRRKLCLAFIASLAISLTLFLWCNNIHVTYANYLRIHDGMSISMASEIFHCPPTRQVHRTDNRVVEVVTEDGYSVFYWDGLEGIVEVTIDRNGVIKRHSFHQKNVIERVLHWIRKKL